MTFPSAFVLAALRHCYLLASTSLDPSTQNAAVLLDRDSILWPTASVNGFPAGIATTAARWQRPAKYTYIEHAERNAIYAACRLGLGTAGATLVCPWAPCADCARAMIQTGIIRLVRRENSANTHGRWRESVIAGDELLREAGIEILDCKVFFGDMPPIRRNGALVLV